MRAVEEARQAWQQMKAEITGIRDTTNISGSR